MAYSTSNTIHDLLYLTCHMTKRNPTRALFTVEDSLLRSRDASSFDHETKPNDCLTNRTSGLSPHTSRLGLGTSRSTKKASPLFRQQKCVSVYDLPDDDGDCHPVGRCTPAPSLFADSLREFVECKRCASLRNASLDDWMDHLGSQHPLPRRWPSSKVNDGGVDGNHPYTSVVDSHKKKKKDVIPRPLNSFMVGIK